MYLNEPRAKELVRAQGLDGLVATTPVNLLYVSGFHSGQVGVDAFGIVPASDKVPLTLVLVHKGMVSLGADHTWMTNIRTYEQSAYRNLFPKPGEAYDKLLPTTPAIDEEWRRLLKESRHLPTNDPYEALALTLRELGLENARLGFDSTEVGEIVGERHLPDLKPAPARELLLHIRMVKTDDEADNLRRSARLNQESLEEAIGTIREGADVADIATTFRTAVVKRGSMPAPHGGFLTGSGERALAARHHHVLKKGDVLFCGAVSTNNSYFSDFLRTFVVGPPSATQVASHRFLEGAFQALRPLMVPGINSSEVGKAVFKAMEDQGADVNNVGMNIHTMGLEIVELEHHVEGVGFPLEPNVCFDVYVLYKEPESGDIFSIERNYLVTEDGWEHLDTLPEALIEIR